MRVLITAARGPAALDLMRHLSRDGHDVVLTDSRAFPLSRFSRHARKFIKTCAPTEDPQRYRRQIRDIIRREAIDLVLPVFEEVLYLAHGRDEFDDPSTIFCDDFETLHEVHNKLTFSRVAHRAGMRVPETHLLTSPDCLAQFVKDSKAYAFKPVYSRFGDQVVLAPDAASLTAVSPTPETPWVAQHYIQGDVYCSFGVAHRGRLRAHGAYQPTCFAGHAGILFHSVQEADILSQVQDFVEFMDFSGLISFDLIRDRDGRFHVIECNPRSTNGVHLFDVTDEPGVTRSGTALSRAILEPDGPLIEAAAGQTKMLGFAMGLYGWNRKNYVRHPLPLRRRLAAARDIVFAFNDPLPAITTPLMLAEIGLTSIRHGVPLTRSGTFDHEWNQVDLPQLEASRTPSAAPALQPQSAVLPLVDATV